MSKAGSGAKRSSGGPEAAPNKEPTRPSVFERLGTKKDTANRPWPRDAKPPLPPPVGPPQPGHKRDDKRLLSAVVVRERDPADWAEWARSLENADADALEQRRQQLQRELDMQMKMESAKDRRDKRVSSSSSSRSSSSTSASSSSSALTSSSSSSAREARKKNRKVKSKRNSSSSSGSDRGSKRKPSKEDATKRDKSNNYKRSPLKKDDRAIKKHDPPSGIKKKIPPKPATKKSLSPIKKTGGTPPINNKNIPKGYILPKHRASSKSPRKDRNKSSSPHPNKDREKEKEKEREKERERLKDRDKEREKERERDKDRDRDRDKDRSRKSKSPRSKPRSRSPLRRHDSHPPRDPRRKDSPTKSRGSSKGRGARQDSDKHRNRPSPSRDDRKDDKRKDNKDRSLERRKDKHDDKDRHDRDRKDREQQRMEREAQREKEREEALARCQERQRERERLKRDQEIKRDQDSKRNTTRGRDRDRGLNKGLEKPGPDKPVERLLPRPEERLAALAATNKNLAISSNRERSETRTERNSRKTDRSADRDRIERLPKRQSDRHSSIDRSERNEYSHSLDRSYDHSHSMDRSYERPGERYEDLVSLDRERERSPGVYPLQGHERDLHYDSPYDMQGSHSRGYLDPDERAYGDHLDDHHILERGYLDDRRSRECNRRDDMSWDGRETSIDPERQYIHHGQLGNPHKDWDNEDYHPDWNRQDRHWQHRDTQHKGLDWVDKDREMESNWHAHRQLPSNNKNSRNRIHEEGNYRNRMDREQNSLHIHSIPPKRSRDQPIEGPEIKKPCTVNVQNSSAGSVQNLHIPPELENPPIPDDLSEISDDADEILNRDDELSEVTESAMAATEPSEIQNTVDHYGMIDLQQFKPDYEPMIEHQPSKSAAKTATKETNGQKPELIPPLQREGNSIVENKTEPSQDQHDGEDGLDNLDFEEISDGELEEDQRVKGLGDALGVDWASLIAEVRGKKDKDGADASDSKEKTGAREYWQPQKVLARIGVSLHLAGEDMINEIFNGHKEVKSETGKSENHVDTKFKLSHPIASIQVAIERRRKRRLSLFGTENGFTRALCARQDLALRRHLCNLPVNECGHEFHPPEPHLFAMAQKLIQKTTA